MIGNKKGSRWTQEEILKLRLFYSDCYTTSAISKELNRTENAITKKAHKIGILKIHPLRVICKNCNKEFETSKTRNLIFCNEECYFEFLRKNPSKIINHCINCGKEIDRRSKRCVKCSSQIKKKPKKYCSDCGIEILRSSSKCRSCASKGRIESEEHKRKISESHRGVKAYQWKGGISFEPYCIKFNDEFKERVREYFNRCCYVCGMGESEIGRKLDIHHVSYNKDTCCDNSKPLFVPLCRSCHMKTNTDRQYWEEFFIISLNYLSSGECYLGRGDT